MCTSAQLDMLDYPMPQDCGHKLPTFIRNKFSFTSERKRQNENGVQNISKWRQSPVE